MPENMEMVIPENCAVGQIRQSDVGIPVSCQAGHGLVLHFPTDGFCASLCRAGACCCVADVYEVATN
jgi:hypothetical protein